MGIPASRSWIRSARSIPFIDPGMSRSENQIGVPAQIEISQRIIGVCRLDDRQPGCAHLPGEHRPKNNFALDKKNEDVRLNWFRFWRGSHSRSSP